MKRRSYRPYNHSVAPASPWEQKILNDLQDAAEIERLQPVGAPSWTRHLAMALSVAGCLALSIFVGVLVVMLRRRFGFEAAVGDAGFWAGLTFSVSLAAGILLAVVDFRGGLTSIETIIGRDLDGDGQVGEPATQLEVMIQGAMGSKRRFLDLPVPDYVLRTFATAAGNGQPISEREWTGPGKLTSKQYREMRDQFLERGLAKWIDPQSHRAGWEFTEDGKAAMKEIAES